MSISFFDFIMAIPPMSFDFTAFSLPQFYTLLVMFNRATNMQSKVLKRNLYKDYLTYHFYYLIRLVYLPFVVVAFS